MSRPQFTLRALLVAMLIVGAFFGGASWQRHELQQEILQAREDSEGLQQENENLVLQIGTYEKFNRVLEIELARTRAAWETEALRRRPKGR
jgi:cell division protein FtsB